MSCSNGLFFFFQAEDGIRDVAVTGVQTCALPIYYQCVSVSRRERERAQNIHADRLPGSLGDLYFFGRSRAVSGSVACSAGTCRTVRRISSFAATGLAKSYLLPDPGTSCWCRSGRGGCGWTG